LKGLTGKKSNNLNNQTNCEQNYPLANDFKSTFYKKDNGLYSTNHSRNSLPFNTLGNG